jgi:hypothetical protein
MSTTIDYSKIVGTTAGVFVVVAGISMPPSVAQGSWSKLPANLYYADALKVQDDEANIVVRSVRTVSLNPYTESKKVKLRIVDGGTKRPYPLEDYNLLTEG